MLNIIDIFNNKPKLKKEMFFHCFQIVEILKITDVTDFSNFLTNSIPISVSNIQNLLITNNVNKKLIKNFKINKPGKAVFELDKKTSIEKSHKNNPYPKDIKKLKIFGINASSSTESTESSINEAKILNNDCYG